MSIYAKTVDGWVPLTGGSREGAPGAPVITNPEGGGVIYFTPGTEGSAGATLAYGSTIEPSNNGETVVVDQETLEVSVEGTSPFTDYVVSVYGVNTAGAGQQSVTDPFQLNYNVASGGTETVVDDYNGTGETWKVHTFRSAGSFSVSSAIDPFSVLIVGNGGGGGAGNGCGVVYTSGGGGGGGGVYTNESMSLTNTTYPVGTWSFNGQSAGNGGTGQGGGNGQNGGASGSPTGHGGGTTGPPGVYGFAAGGGGGAGGNGGNSDSFTGGSGGAGVVRYITGSPATYGQGGRGQEGNGCDGLVGLGFPGSQTGGVIIAYQIGVSSTTQIKNAQAAQAARSQGYDDGYDVGVADGRVQRNAAIAEVDLVKEAVEAKPKRTRKKAD